jgi:hypothetical protein
MSKVLSDNLNFDRMRNKQFNEYLAVNTKVIKTYEDEKRLFDKMTNYDFKTTIKRGDELEQRKHIFLQLDKEINAFRKYEKEIDLRIEKIEKYENHLKHKIKDIEFKNERIKMNMDSIRYL